MKCTCCEENKKDPDDECKAGCTSCEMCGALHLPDELDDGWCHRCLESAEEAREYRDAVESHYYSTRL